MKKAMKKHISLLLAVLMLVASVGFNAFAATAECQHQTSMSDSRYFKEVSATCDEGGYIIYYCIKCSNPDTGAMVEVKRDNFSSPLGHQWGEAKYESNGSGDYRMYKLCTREYLDAETGKPVVCNEKSIEKDGEDEVVYHLVEFYHNKLTASYDESIDYAKIADTYKSAEKLTEVYVKDGEDAYYEDTDLLYRDPTKSFARYNHIGWADYDFEATAEEKLPEDGTYYKQSTITDVTENMKLYPVFEGLTETTYGRIEHNVVFYIINDEDEIEQGTVNQKVAHGAYAKFSKPDGTLYTVTKPEDLTNTYKFNGWVTSAGKAAPIPMEEIESTPIYGSVSFLPKFDAIAKNYVLEFYKEGKDANGKTVYNSLFKYGSNNKNAVFENVHLKRNLFVDYADKDNLAYFQNDKTLFEKQSDKEYIYLWTGKWAILMPDGTVGRTVDLKDFEVYTGEFRTEKNEDGSYVTYENSDEIKKTVRLVPVYKRNRQIYTVDIVMLIPENEDTDYYRKDAEVQVVANNGQLVASGYTNKDGKFRCNLYYQVPFTVTVATQDGKYLGNYLITDLDKFEGNIEKEAELNKCYVAMQLNPDYETHCKCIHHTPFLQPIIVRIFNILYNFFNYKYVCCYDMYSTIGPLLDYTA